MFCEVAGGDAVMPPGKRMRGPAACVVPKMLGFADYAESNSVVDFKYHLCVA